MKIFLFKIYINIVLIVRFILLLIDKLFNVFISSIFIHDKIKFNLYMYM